MLFRSIHESGHATVAVLLDLQVTKLTLDCASLRYLRNAEGHRRSAIVSFAGPCAEIRSRGLSPDGCAELWGNGEWTGDLENIERYAQPGERAQLRQEADAIVSRYWRSIVRLADVLATREEMTGAQVCEVLRGTLPFLVGRTF